MVFRDKKGKLQVLLIGLVIVEEVP